MAGTGLEPGRDGRPPVLDVRALEVSFPLGTGGRRLRAVAGVGFDVAEGETLGLVGESGCGKSTTGRAILQLLRPDAGSVRFEGQELVGLTGHPLRAARRRLQMIFQDPISSLNPRRSVRDIVREPLIVHGVAGSRQDHRSRVDELLATVGIDPALGERRPHQFSGGQCQRISLARALVGEPRLLICDEPVSALDVSIQAQVLNLLEDIKAGYGLAMVFISHDLSVVRHVSDRVAVMYLGVLCEIGAADALYRTPAHPYTRALLDAIPTPVPRRAGHRTTGDGPPGAAGGLLGGEIPSALDPPSGCRFRTRCALAQDRCAEVVPELRAVGEDHQVACHFPLV